MVSQELQSSKPEEYLATEMLQGGIPVRIRGIRPDDKARLLEHFKKLSPQVRRYRFFAGKRSLTRQELKRLTELDFVNHVGLALALAINVEGDEQFIGVY